MFNLQGTNYWDHDLCVCYRKYRANIKIKGTKIALGAYHNEIDAAKVCHLLYCSPCSQEKYGRRCLTCLNFGMLDTQIYMYRHLTGLL